MGLSYSFEMDVQYLVIICGGCGKEPGGDGHLGAQVGTAPS